MSKPTPTYIAHRLGISISHASMVLRQVEKPSRKLANQIYLLTDIQLAHLAGRTKEDADTIVRLDGTVLPEEPPKTDPPKS
ncbi:MAG: hypothetical protein KGP14_00390 [Betaproteobacteria bacterium]|nr:hypothetical protein [Betaproteobacteria bacterium]